MLLLLLFHSRYYNSQGTWIIGRYVRVFKGNIVGKVGCYVN
jgi:hypothetical protein